MDKHGFYRVAAASPRLSVGNPVDNAREILTLLEQAQHQQVEFVVFPELCLSGYSCGDLFHDRTLLSEVRSALLSLAQESARLFDGYFVVGLPLMHGDQLFNVAALVGKGCVHGLTPKYYLPNEKEFYEQRWFTPWALRDEELITFLKLGSEEYICQSCAWKIPSTEETVGDAPVVGIEVCEDLWAPVPRSANLMLGGANIIANPSASNEITTKADYRRQLVASQSARLAAAYVYSSAGVTESTTDLVFGGHCLIAENGVILAETSRFSRRSEMIVADIDIERLTADRLRVRSWNHQNSQHIIVPSLAKTLDAEPPKEPTPRLLRSISPHPFVPSQSDRLRERCEEIFHIQVAGLAKRVETAGLRSLQIGISGGLDSTLALLVAAKTCDLLELDRTVVHGITMPGFGTSGRTLANAEAIMGHLKISAERIDIRPLCYDTFRAIGHKPFGIDVMGMSMDDFIARISVLSDDQRKDLVFENVQARVRTLLLMSRGFVLGTGDLSELALGWATYNGDHMSMYNPNVSVPKTLVRFLVRWVADHEFEGPTRDVLHSIADTEISPELLPPSKEGAIQSTEQSVGPYELHDFFLYHFLRFGFRPGKIFRLAQQVTFDRPYPSEEIKHWLGQFFHRFFTSQFKRSCLPDGPKVGSVSLSPRGDWRMPSDADAHLWLAEIEALPV